MNKIKNKKIFGVYKEKGITSYDVIDKIKKITGEKRVGHAGTLDPLAKGVLVVAVSRENTKKLKNIVKKEKEYFATIKLGEYSATDDEEGEKEKVKILKIPSKEKIQTTLNGFTGIIWQRPPLYSAVKIKGKPAYKLARAKKEFTIKKRQVEVKDLKLIKYKWPYLKIKVITGPGTYIRSLARDIGRKLNTGGYLKSLERIKVGKFKKENCLKI